MNCITKISLLLLLLVSGVVPGQAQQLPQFSQYMFNGMYINPGYAGYKEDGYIQATYRAQWMNFPGAPKTLSVSADFSANEGRMGFGIMMMSDQLGPAKTNGGLLSYAYRIRVGSSSMLGLGVSAGATQYSINYSKLKPNNEDDIVINEGIANLFTPNLNTGIFFHNERFYAGLSAYNMIGKKVLTREDIALAYHDFHYYLTLGLLMDLSEHVRLKPSVLLKEVKGSPMSIDLNAMFLFKERLWLGSSYRMNTKLGKSNLPEGLNNRNALAFILEVFATKDLRIGYAYDYNLNVLNNLRNNSHEVSLGYYLSPRKIRMRNQRWF